MKRPWMFSAFTLALLLSGCLTAARKTVAPESWVAAYGSSPKQQDVDSCKEMAGLKWASLDTLDAKLVQFSGCMRDHGYHMK